MDKQVKNKDIAFLALSIALLKDKHSLLLHERDEILDNCFKLYNPYYRLLLRIIDKEIDHISLFSNILVQYKALQCSTWNKRN